jgi:hypothetical protein
MFNTRGSGHMVTKTAQYELDLRKALAEIEGILAKYEALGLTEELEAIRKQFDHIRRELAPSLSEH